MKKKNNFEPGTIIIDPEHHIMLVLRDIPNDDIFFAYVFYCGIHDQTHRFGYFARYLVDHERVLC